ncbi:MAG: N-6 DNA methylase [Rhodospirillales bacterium]
MIPSANQKEAVKKLYSFLGYQADKGLIKKAKFEHAKCHRFALLQADKFMGVEAVYVLHSPSTERFTPVVYISFAEDEGSAKEIHRKVWSQSLTPFLIVVTNEDYWVCNGFGFSTGGNSRDFRRRVPHAALNEKSKDLSSLKQLHALHLKSSIGWREMSMNGTHRVDQTLLRNLDELANVLILGRPNLPKLSMRRAHALIGRMMYILMLRDKEYLNDDWLESRNHDATPFVTRTANWSAIAFWNMNADIDAIFNGSAFQLSSLESEAIKASHIKYIRDVMRFDTSPNHEGDQLSLFQIDFRSLRVETLSAVYELFLSRMDSSGRRREGAFYTPPFLVDFVLDQIDEKFAFTQSKKFYDPATGSGVFLVGIFRRIVERLNWQKRDNISAASLRHILQNCIFASEKEWEACQVAALSLYLTMLDYIGEDERKEILAQEQIALNHRVFPALIGQNIIEADYFDVSAFPESFPTKFDCIVGNPPWKISPQDSSEFVEQRKTRYAGQIGRGQLAELFVLDALERHKKPAGVAAFLIPTASLINTISAGFRNQISRLGLSAVSELSHLRRILFEGPDHAASVIAFSGDKSDDTLVSILSPVRSTQPISRSGNKAVLWALLTSPADVEFVEREKLQLTDNWNSYLNATPIDRRIFDFVSGRIRSGSLHKLGDAVNQLIFKRGDREKATGIPREYQLTTDLNPRQNYLLQCGQGGQRVFGSEDAIVPLPKNVLKNVKDGFKDFIGGNVVLVPRSGAKVIYCAKSAGFNDTLACIAVNPSHDINREKKSRYLRAVARYLNSNAARYFLSLIAPSVMIAIPRLSLENLRELPVFFEGPEDKNLELFLKADDSEVDNLVYNLLGISGTYADAIDEFIEFRSKFKNANIPQNAQDILNEEMIPEYKDVLLSRLSLPKKLTQSFPHSFQKIDDLWVGSLAIGISDKQVDLDADMSEALAHYEALSANAFTENLHIWRKPDSGNVVIFKPLDHQFWTIAKAFSDGEALFATLLSPASLE